MNEENFETALQRIEEAAATQSADLNLSGLELTKLPGSIGQLTQLTKLNLSDNQLTELPELIGQLSGLEILHLNYNQITKLPESIGQLTELRDLSFDENQVTKLPESIGRLTKLRTLSFNENQITKLPESIGQLTELRTLSLYGNLLIKLPESIGQLTELRKFDSYNSRLREIPESIGHLTKLEGLYIFNNQVTKLPESIGQLTQLEELYLLGNRLTELPASIIKLKKLRILLLQGNPRLGLPAELVGNVSEILKRSDTSTHNPREILDFYFRVRENGSPLNEAKLILVGRGAVGKTSLVNQLVYSTFNRGEPKTQGIKIDKWGIELEDGGKVNLNVWDFGGQEIMHATHQFFLTERSLYLLVLNGREGMEDADAEYWLKLIDSFGGKSPVIIVLNKISEQHFELNRSALLQKYPNIREFISTDCADNIGIEKLQQAIKRETDKLDELRVGFPSEWFAVKDRLSKMKENYLSFKEYRGICKRLKVGKKQHQEMLAKYLNQLGIVLNFKDDARLRDTHVLNPHWVTTGIYMLLNSPYLSKKGGEISLGEVSRVLPEKDYPVEMHRFIFDLMKKFYLCFSFPDDECRYLIPELLSKEQPPEAEQFNPAESLNFQYRYAILPEGILPRFIVRTNILSRELPRWRSGVILEFEDCRALVKADIVDKMVSISISGENAESRRRLLAVIRSDFKRLHDEIPNLEVRSMVPLANYPAIAFPYEDLVVMEKMGESEFKQVVEGQMITVNIGELLNGVDLKNVEEVRQRENVGAAVRLFYSYARKDETLRNEFETQLKILEQSKLITSFHEGQIGAGTEWEKEVDKNLESADIILFLVSPDFFSSENYAKQVTRALELHAKEQAVVVPVLIRDTHWTGAPFGNLKPLPDNQNAVKNWSDRDSAWRNVAEGIEKLARKIRAEKHARNTDAVGLPLPTAGPGR